MCRIVDMWTAMASDLFLTSEVHGFDPLRIKVDGEPAVDIHRDVELRYGILSHLCYHTL